MQFAESGLVPVSAIAIGVPSEAKLESVFREQCSADAEVDVAFSLDDYVDVAERIAKFYEDHPDGSLTTEKVYTLDLGGQQFVVCHAKAWRAPDDPFPGDGVAWEVVPGKTPYTKDSELMNAQTAAWGRAIVACGILASKKIASAQEVKARQGNGSKNGSEAPSGPQELPERYVDWLRLAIRSYNNTELADDAAWAKLVDSAKSNQAKQQLVKSLEAALVHEGGDPEAVRERWQARKVAA